jgi:hypothetical protein
VDTAIHERLIDARSRLRSALQSGVVPASLAQTAQQCLIDLDCALSDALSSTRTRMLLAQIDALVSVACDGAPPRTSRDADSH